MKNLIIGIDASTILSEPTVAVVMEYDTEKKITTVLQTVTMMPKSLYTFENSKHIKDLKKDLIDTYKDDYQNIKILE